MDDLTMLAARLWRTESEDAGMPQSVAARRTVDAFIDPDFTNDDTRARWMKFARAAQEVQGTRIEELEAERDEALRRRDEWRKRAEGHVEIVNALKAKTAGKDSRTLGRALLGAAFTQCEAELTAEKARADRAEAMLKEAVEEMSDTATALRAIAGMDLMSASVLAWNTARDLESTIARIAQEGKE